MPFPDGAFDAVVSNFGVHHVPRPARALAEALRVLRPGGRLRLCNLGRAGREYRLAALAGRDPPCMASRRGASAVSGGGLGSEEAVRRVLNEAGFAAPGTEMVRREWQLAHPGDLVAALRRGTVRTAALIDAQRPGGAAGDRSRDRAARPRPIAVSDHYAVPIVAILGSGAKSAVTPSRHRHADRRRWRCRDVRGAFRRRGPGLRACCSSTRASSAAAARRSWRR